MSCMGGITGILFTISKCSPQSTVRGFRQWKTVYVHLRVCLSWQTPLRLLIPVSTKTDDRLELSSERKACPVYTAFTFACQLHVHIETPTTCGRFGVVGIMLHGYAQYIYPPIKCTHTGKQHCGLQVVLRSRITPSKTRAMVLVFCPEHQTWNKLDLGILKWSNRVQVLCK